MFVLFGIGSCRGAVLTSHQRSGELALDFPGLGCHLSACGPPVAQGMVLHVGTRPPFPPEFRREALAIVAQAEASRTSRGSSPSSGVRPSPRGEPPAGKTRSCHLADVTPPRRGADSAVLQNVLMRQTQQVAQFLWR